MTPARHGTADAARLARAGGPDPATTRRDRTRSLLVTLVAVLAGGLVVGLLDPVAAGAAARWSTTEEAASSRQLVFGLLGGGAGLVTAVVLCLRPRPWAVQRLLVAAPAAAAASLLGYTVGHLLGVPWWGEPSVLFVWPLTLSVLCCAYDLVWAVRGD